MKTSRSKVLLNGLVVGLVGFAVYMIPALVVAFGLAFEMGSQRQGSAAISATISRKIAAMYAENGWLQVGLIIIVGLLTVWRVRAAKTGRA